MHYCGGGALKFRLHEEANAVCSYTDTLVLQAGFNHEKLTFLSLPFGLRE